jgi:HAD superfamily hydrolase (TIGR01484 family)
LGQSARMNWQVRLVSTDFDGTIFDEFAAEPIARVFQDTIAQFQADGGKWVINTGRDQASLLEELARCRVTVRPDYLVVVEREIHVREGTRYRADRGWNERCERCHRELALELEGDFPSIVTWIRDNSTAAVFSDVYSPLAVVATSNEEMDAIDARLRRLLEVRPQAAWMRNDVYARLCHADYSKGTALQEIQRQLTMNASEVFAIGDHLNDLPMLDPAVAAHVAVPSNAVPAVLARMREIGGRISEYSCGQAVAHELSLLRR